MTAMLLLLSGVSVPVLIILISVMLPDAEYAFMACCVLSVIVIGATALYIPTQCMHIILKGMLLGLSALATLSTVLVLSALLIEKINTTRKK